MLKGIETVVYYAADLNAARDWYAETFNIKTNFDEPFYVGFTVGGDELGIHPIGGKPHDPGGAHSQVVYWSVDDIDAVMAHLMERGATKHHDVQSVGGGIRIGSVLDPFGNPFGVIQNPKSPNK